MRGITGLVNTRNAAATLDLCLASMKPHVDELLVVDMMSSDGTAEVARSFGARVVPHEPLGFVEPARAAGVETAAHDWILILDADEVLPATLGHRLREIAQGDEADYVIISWRNYLFGAATEHGPFGPRIDRHPRFFRRSQLIHSAELHQPPTPVPGARALILPPAPTLSVAHYAYADVSEWVARSDRYTTIEAESALRSGKQPPGTLALLFEVLRTFVRGFLRQRGYRDGWRGFHTSALMAQYRLTAGLKAQQLARVGTEADVRRRYREDARRVMDS